MDLKTRMEVLPCGKCEDMIDCDNCLFQKEAKELYEQIRADAIQECIKFVDEWDSVIADALEKNIKQQDIE